MLPLPRAAGGEHGPVVHAGRDDVDNRVAHDPVGLCGLITP
ncbi:hypothetical protein ACIQXA_20565 [Streptomyces massasporeus]